MIKLPKKTFLIFLIFILGLGIGLGTTSFKGFEFKNQLFTTQQDPYEAFLSEIYDKTKENYWDKVTDEALVNLFKLATEKLGGGTLELKSNTKGEFISAYSKNLKKIDEDKRKEVTINIVAAVLANLAPAGRSGLYTQKLETQLNNTVSNINPEKDLYKDLGLDKGATKESVKETSKKLVADLEKKAEGSPEAKKKLEEVKYAEAVLTEPDKKERYDSSGVEPTVFSKIVTPNVAYVFLKKFSPTTYDEFQKVFVEFEKPNSPKALIFDLSSNVGGAIDVLPFFLGNFIGKDQYAYEFFHQGDYKPFKTTLDKLIGINNFKQVVILVDNKTQSSAEMMASVLKKYHIGVLVGIPTKGWGTVERVFPLDHQIDASEKLSLFLVHSITIRDDGQPIEGRGVEPNINTTNPNWQSELNSYFNNAALTNSVKNIINQKLD